jgi:hypothetical protein
LQAVGKVQSEIEKNFRDDRAARDEHQRTMHEQSGLMRDLERSTGGRIARLEQELQREVDVFKRDMDEARTRQVS